MKKNSYQHQPLRVPRGWDDQSRALVIQIEALFDDLYTKVGQLRTVVDSMIDNEEQEEE